MARSLIRLAGSGTSLGAVLLAIRWYMRYRSLRLQEPMRLAAGPIATFYFDAAYVIGVTAVFALAMLLARRSRPVQSLLLGVFRGVALISVLLALVNIRALAELGRPLSYQWLYYSHFFRSLDTYNALSTILSWKWPAQALAICAVMFATEFLVVRLLDRIAHHRFARVALLAFAVPIGIALSLGQWWIARPGRDLAWIRNPVVALVESALHADERPVLARTATAVGPGDFLTVAERSTAPGGGHREGYARSDGVRNVLIVVLESSAVRYVGAYGATYGVTPELDTLHRRGRLFANIYAHGPSTTNSLLALLLSIYPWHTFRPVTRVYPAIELPSLSTELKRRGYRTGFFNAEDNRFQRADEFLANRFDVVTDYEDFPCDEQERNAEGKDHCAVRTFESWLDGSPPGPFLAVVWTAQTHWPYSVTTRARVPHTADSMATRFRRYLEALKDGDRAVGDLVRLLAQRQLLDSTLVVVLGDHGEAFGQHGHYLHRDLFEEEVHIPLLFINRRLFQGETDSLVGGMIDVAPTVMDLLDLPMPWSWQGRSLFDPAHSGRAYMFGPYSGLFGLREGERKLILDDASRNPPQLYDLQQDPEERRNIASESREMVARGRERLAAWVQYQDRFFERILAASGR
ncbi:MAG: sulfatase-like hydrolase/transferase [bacterium]